MDRRPQQINNNDEVVLLLDKRYGMLYVVNKYMIMCLIILFLILYYLITNRVGTVCNHW